MGTLSDPGDGYLQVVKDHLHKLDEELLTEDIDVLCKYIVLRFLKTSPEVHAGVSKEEIGEKLHEFVDDIFPFLVTFLTVVNSTPLRVEGESS